ncbi:MAG TPA: acyltransferase family protein [Acidimicrobiales bacterium]|jgi:peptidoglycan/LPS O-acetylase OafA/YrhL|nr:acyltransferase family protein [Acidimicrobiales bacterium]
MDDEVSEAPHRRLAYLPALDGVRAFAVVAVMMYHGGLSFATGGFMGVDTFFVLSGFLITSLLVSEWRETLTIRLKAFWARRARRLLPALLLMLLFVALYASVIVPRGTYPALRLDALSTLIYVANWHFVLVGSNYFNQTAAASPLIHTWSLAVEEQFYLIWPLVVLGVLRLTRTLRSLLVLSCVAAVGSAIEMYLLFRPAAFNRVYLGTDTRSQCLFIGAALAVALTMLSQRSQASGRLTPGELWHPAQSRGRLVCGTLGLVGAVVSVILWITIDTNSSFPYSGGFFLIGLATAGVILAIVGAPRSVVPRLLALAPIRYIGRISYGLYIWHWPLFIWINNADTGITGFWLFALKAAVTFGVSVVSYHLVEQPIRQGTFVRDWRGWLAVPVGVGVVLVALVAATTGSTVLASTIPPPTGSTTTTASTTTSTTGPTTTTSAPVATTAPTTTTTVKPPPVSVLLLGDSTAFTLGEGLAQKQEENKYNYTMIDDGILGCGVVNGPEVEVMGEKASVNVACNGSPLLPGTPLDKQPWPYQWLSDLSLTRPNVVMLLAGRWEVVDREYEGKWTDILHPAFAAYVKSQLEAASNLVNATGARLVFLTAPCTDEGNAPNGTPWPEDSSARLAEYNKLVRQVAAERPQTQSVVDLDAAACPGGHYTATKNGQTIRNVSDGVHFTIQGGYVLAPYLMPQVVAAGRAQAAQAG